MLVTLRGDTHDMGSRETGQTALSPRISSVEFSPGLLEQTDPELAVPTGSETWFAIGSNRQVLVNYHGSFLAVQEETDHVDAGLVNFLCHKQSLHTVRELSQ